MYTRSSHSLIALAVPGTGPKAVTSGFTYWKKKMQLNPPWPIMQPGPHQPCNSLLLSGLRISAKPQTTKALNISLKLTQNLSWLYVMPVCAWAVKVVDPISRLCNLKLQLIKPAALSAFSLKSHSLWAQPQWYFQTVEGGLPVLGSQG